MADEKQPTRWYPTPDHPRQDTDRIIFDKIYALQDGQQQAVTPPSQAVQGMSATVVVSGNFNVGGKTFTRMTFKNGILVAVS